MSVKNARSLSDKPKRTTKPQTEAARVNRQRQRLRPKTPEELAQLANEASELANDSKDTGLGKTKSRAVFLIAERATRQAMRELAPRAGMFTPEVMEQAQKMSREALILMANAIPKLTETIIRLAEEGDSTALSIAARWLPSPQEAMSLYVPQGMTPEQASDFLAGQALSGNLSIKEANAGLDLIQTHASVQLNQALVRRLHDLRTRLEKVSVAPQDALAGRPLPVADLTLDEDGKLVEVAQHDTQYRSSSDENH